MKSPMTEEHIKLNCTNAIFKKSGQINPVYEEGQTVERRENRRGGKNVWLSFLVSFSLNKKLRRGRGKEEERQNYFRIFYG